VKPGLNLKYSQILIKVSGEKQLVMLILLIIPRKRDFSSVSRLLSSLCVCFSGVGVVVFSSDSRLLIHLMKEEQKTAQCCGSIVFLSLKG